MSPRIVRGYCPMGCGESLVLEGARIKCSDFACPNPESVHLILDDRETYHVVTINEHDFSLKHPLRERIDDELLDCAVHAALGALSGPPAAPGVYRVWMDAPGNLCFEEL